MSQMRFLDAEYAGKRKKTRREVFQEEMDLVVPWKPLLELIEPHYPMARRGRLPYPLESMLRVQLMQNWFALSDPAMEEALSEIASLRGFSHLSLGEPIPDETTILNLRHLREANELPEDILKAVNAHLARKGLLLKRGSIVDATIEEHREARVPAKVAHSCSVIKRQFGLVKVRFRGLQKTTEWLLESPLREPLARLPRPFSADAHRQNALYRGHASRCRPTGRARSK